MIKAILQRLKKGSRTRPFTSEERAEIEKRHKLACEEAEREHKEFIQSEIAKLRAENEQQRIANNFFANCRNPDYVRVGAEIERMEGLPIDEVVKRLQSLDPGENKAAAELIAYSIKNAAKISNQGKGQ